MVFRGSKKVLFDTAYTSYREIIKETEKIYSGLKENFELGHDKFRQLPIIALSVDIYLQVNLFKIAISDNRISDDEKHFIRSLIDNSELLRKIPKYKSFITKLDLETFEKIKNDDICGDKNTPLFLEMCLQYDKYNSSQIGYKIINLIEVIYNSLIELDDIQSRSEKKYAKTEISRLMEHAITVSKEPLIQKHEASSGNQDEIEATETLSELLEELNSLVGLDGVKKDIADTINLIKVNEIRKKQGLKEMTVTHHLVFTGSPGTGKTTVARLVAKIYKVLGVVKKGNFVETDRSGLVAEYVGHTATKTKEVINKALDGILFIDEAYSLVNNASLNDFGHEAVDTLVKAMEDHRDNLIVIVAGYEKEMTDFINSNPGLSSRFSRYINFENYSVEELKNIFQNICQKNGFIADKSALDALTHLLQSIESPDVIGNARGIRNIFERAMLNQAGRILKIDNPQKEDLSLIQADDIPTVEMIENKKNNKKKIGFNN